MKVGSLFSGAGCGDLGLEWAGFDHAWFCEVDEYARKILGLRWPGKPIYEDIRKVDFTQVEPVDMLAGGFPCQDISVAGKGAGLEGARSGLWSEYARAIAEIRPRYALIENSPALVTRGLDVVLSDLAALGYDAEWHCVPASSVGAPHRRDRIWIVAHSSGVGRRAGENESEHARDNRGEFGDSRCDLPDADMQGSQGGGRLVETPQRRQTAPVMRHDLARPSEGGRRWWAVEPGLGRVVNGVANVLDQNMRMLGYADSNNSEAVAAFDNLRGKMLRDLWEQEQSSTSPHRTVEQCCDDPMSGMPQGYAHARWYLGERIKAESDLRDLWGRICAKQNRGCEDLREKMLVGIREKERQEKVGENRVNRLKCIGNGQVPHCTYFFGRLIQEHARQTYTKRVDSNDY